MHYNNAGLNKALELTMSGRLQEALAVLMGLGGGAAAGTTLPGMPDGLAVPSTGSGQYAWQPQGSSAACRHLPARNRRLHRARPQRLRQHLAVRSGISRTPPRPAHGHTTSTFRRGTQAMRRR